MSNQIIETLKTLQTEDDEVWTADGKPKLDSFPFKVTRKELVKVAPHFTRENPVIGVEFKIEETPDEEIKTEIKGLQKEVVTINEKEELQAKVDEAAIAVAIAQKTHSVARKELDNYLTVHSKEHSRQTTQKDIMFFIKSQNQQRITKAARREAILASSGL